jgi:prevent-host-death family protein
MVRTISAAEARANIDNVFAAAQNPDEPVIVEENGAPLVVVISPEEFERYRQQRIEEAWQAIDRMRERNAHLDPDEVLAEVTEVVEEVRRERYEAEQRALADSRRHQPSR